MLLFLVTAALAWDFDEPITHETTSSGFDAAAFGTPAGGRVAIADGIDGLAVYDLTTGALLDSISGYSERVAWAPDGTGVLRCGLGVDFVPWSSGALGVPVAVSSEPCSAIASSSDGVLVAIDGTVYLYDTELEDTGLGLGVASFVAESGAALATATQFGRVVRVLDGAVTDESTSQDIVDLAGDDDRFWYSARLGRSVVALDGGEVSPSIDTAPSLTVGDVDGDGFLDVVAWSPDTLMWHSSLAETWTQEPIPFDNAVVRTVHLADSDCASLVSIGEDAFTVLPVVGCHGDADEDGYTSEEGDCDDGDPDRAPGRVETCDGTDEDCSGHADDAPVAVDLPEGVSEGDFVTLTAVGGCPMAGDGFDGDGNVFCEGNASTETCVFARSGLVTVRFVRHEDVDVVLFEGQVDVANLPPEISETEYSFVVDAPQEVAIGFYDPGGDLVSFELLEGPDFVSLSSDGVLSATVPRRRDYDLRIRATDEDGAAIEVDVVLRGVRASSPSGCSDGCNSSCNADPECSCANAAIVPGWFVFLGVAFIRRRRHPAT